MMPIISPQIKYTTDIGAIGVAWAHMLGFWKDNVGTIAATLSVVWLTLQVGDFLLNKAKKKRKK